MKIKRNLALVASSALAATVLTACGAGADAGGVIRMKIETGVPAGHHLSENVFDRWAKDVEEATDGQVEVQVYSGGTLGSLASTPGDLAGGVYDVGIGLPSYFLDSELFGLTIGTLAYAYPDIDTGNQIISKYWKEHKEDFKVSGVRTVGITTTDVYSFFSNTKITDSSDLKGLKVKTQSELDAGIIQEWGGTPIQMSTGETYSALDKGTLDVAPYSEVSVLSTKFYEVAPYLLRLNAWGTVATAMVSERFMDKLPEDLVDTFDEDLFPKLEEYLQGTYKSEMDVAAEKLPQLIEESGGEIVEPSAEANAEFRSAAKAEWKRWISMADERGFDGQALMDSYTKAMRDAGAEPPL